MTGCGMTQSDANCSPASNSLIIRKNTGNFFDFRVDYESLREKSAQKALNDSMLEMKLNDIVVNAEWRVENYWPDR